MATGIVRPVQGAVDYFELCGSNNPHADLFSLDTSNFSMGVADITGHKVGDIVIIQFSIQVNGSFGNNTSRRIGTFTNLAIDKYLGRTYKTFALYPAGGTYAGRMTAAWLNTWGGNNEVSIQNGLGGTLTNGTNLRGELIMAYTP